MEGTGLSQNVALLPALAEVVTMRSGTVCCVDSSGLAVALAAGPSRAGSWVGVVSMPDVGWEAAQDLGLDLGRTIAVPDPGEHWLSVTAGLIDVASVVLVRPRGRVSDGQAGRIAARLRQRGTVLIVDGVWPRVALSLSTLRNRWNGLGWGSGHLQSREVTVQVHFGGAAIHEACWGLPTADRGVALLSHTPVAEQTVPAAAMAG